MKKTILILISIALLSCTKQSQLSKKFHCKAIKIEKTKEIIDFKKNFKLTIPTNWKTKLYFTEFESEIFAADTLKQLTESFILGTSFNYGALNFDVSFHKKIDSILVKNNLLLINSGNHLFQSNLTYWYIAKGFRNGFTYHTFNLTVKQSENTYFNAYSEIYGETKVNERICETISILEKIEFLQ
ncbi:hypothetical protein [Lutibacter sp.]